MNKIIKRKLIGAAICLVLGIISLINLAINYKIISEELLSYVSGFSSAIITVGLITLIKYTRIMKNQEIICYFI